MKTAVEIETIALDRNAKGVVAPAHGIGMIVVIGVSKGNANGLENTKKLMKASSRSEPR